MTDQSTQPKLEIRIIPVTPLQQNTSMIWSTETMEGVFIDPGGEVDKLMGAADQFGVKIVGVWLLDELEAQGAKYGITDGRNVKPDRYLHDGDELELSGNKFGVAHCPGHTPGHVVIYNKAGALAFVGDVLFRGSIGRTDFPRGNHQQLIDSITGKLWPLGNEMRFVPGHGPLSTFGQERQDNPFVADSITGYQGAATQNADATSQKLAKRWS